MGVQVDNENSSMSSSCPFKGVDVIDKMGDGVSPVNPLGTCFDATAFQAVGPNGGEGRPDDLRICHGIGICQHSKRERTHAWLEYRIRGVLIAHDVIFQCLTIAKDYREVGKFNYVVEYTFEKFMELWGQHDYPGPWDRKIRKLTEKLQEGRK